MAHRSYKGAIVRLVRDIETKGGTLFKKGLLMRVIDSTSGGLTLRCYKRGWRQSIRCVEKRSVEVVRWAKTREWWKEED